ncbi:MAG: hypothetical protein FWG98_07590, partial [Candidatus Cloacimonetes bacterium]|nr:hypothetical protein [Candidatus Cloacimonadota bacterium]
MTLKRHLLAILLLGLIGCFLGQTLIAETLAEAPSNFHDEDAGSEENPFLIANLANLRWLSETPAVWDIGWGMNRTGYFFLQTADIEASETIHWNNGRGFTPIGYFSKFSHGYFERSFVGRYDGNHFKISNLFINAPESIAEEKTVSFALFSDIYNATIMNVQIENIHIATIINDPSWFLSHVRGTLVGTAIDSRIINCSASGQISSENHPDNEKYLIIGG